MKKYLIPVLAMLCAACTSGSEKTTGITYANMDLSVRPGDDFARYAAGFWTAHNPQPPEYPMWGTTIKLMDDNVKTIASLIQEIAASDNRKGSVEQKIGDLYNMVMDSVRLNSEGAAPLQKELEKIKALDSREALLANCEKEHDDLLFSLFVAPDDKDSDNNIVTVAQGGLSLGNREYYLSDDPQNVAVREIMKEHIVKMFSLAGYTQDEARGKMEHIWAMETAIAEPYYSQEAQRDPEANYHKISVDSLTAICGGFNWNAYLAGNRYDKTTEVNLCQPEPVAKACELLMTASLDDLKSIYEWRVINSLGSLLSDDFSDEVFDMRQKIYGAQQKAPRWKIAEGLVEGLMSDAIGQMYVKKYFPPKAKKEMIELVGNLRASLADRIKAQEWMSEETKAVALEKLAAYGLKVGYPDKWDDLSDLVIDPSLSLVENVIAARWFYWNLNYDKTYNKPVDKSEWAMPAQMVNAYYNPYNNEICFPAGFLQPPLFDLNADAAANYGAIGVVIGHEMTHGFDDQGRQFDKNGNLCQWWNDADVEAFAKPCAEMTEFFNGLWVIPGELHANGALCLGENIADHGGLNIAYNAFQKWQDKHGRLSDETVTFEDGTTATFTPEQRFFLSYANVWASTTSDEFLRYITMMDPHSCDRLRVNGALAQCDYWYDAFDIQPGDSLYVAPENRVRVW